MVGAMGKCLICDKPAKRKYCGETCQYESIKLKGKEAYEKKRQAEQLIQDKARKLINEEKIKRLFKDTGGIANLRSLKVEYEAQELATDVRHVLLNVSGGYEKIPLCCQACNRDYPVCGFAPTFEDRHKFALLCWDCWYKYPVKFSPVEGQLASNRDRFDLAYYKNQVRGSVK